MVRIAVNGMGRIGRLLVRRLAGLPGIELVAVNDVMEPENLAYLLKYDTVYGTLPATIEYADGVVHFNDKKIHLLQQADPRQLPWKALKIDVVLECSGRFTTRALAQQHLAAGARKVLLSTTGSQDIPLVIYGHNQHILTADMDMVSPGGCMTNCSTHLLNLLNSIGIESAHLAIQHSYTSRQELVDGPHAQFRRGRAAAESIIPVEIDLPVSLERVLPALAGKLAAVSVRVPVPNGALADCTAQLQQPTTAQAINQLFRSAAEQDYKGIIEYTEAPLVSADIRQNPHSCVIDGTLTSVIGNQVKIFAWFDNEYGFTSRMIDCLQYWAIASR